MIVLYHGTDARIIRMTEEERAKFKNACIIAIKYMWPFFESYYNEYENVPINKPGYEGCTTYCQKLEKFRPLLDDEMNPYGYLNLHSALTCWNACLRGNGQYQYGSLYVTGTRQIAKNYARRSFAFGEIGLIAYRMYEASQKIHFDNWNPDNTTLDAMERIFSFGESEPEPIVLEIEVNDTSELLMDDGSPFYNLKNNTGHYRLISKIQLENCKVIPYNGFIV